VKTPIPSSLVLASLLALLAPVAAQGDQSDLVVKRTKKLASPFLQSNAWFTDFDKAKAAAKKSNKVIFGYFTRSFSP
jgi:ABC-type sugar transport system substrate-binding protein